MNFYIRNLVSALLALTFLTSVDASLEEYLLQIQLPPMCDMCVRLFTEVSNMPDSTQQDTRARDVCSAFPPAAKTGSFSLDCVSATSYAVASPIEHCASIGICPTACNFCETRVVTDVYQAWGSDQNAIDFCHAQWGSYRSDENECMNRVETFKGKMPFAADFDPAFEFCHTEPYGCDDFNLPEWTYSQSAQTCIDAPLDLQCPNGVVDVTYGEVCTSVPAVDDSSLLLSTEVEDLCFVNPCKRDLSCDCNSGYKNDGPFNCVLDTDSNVFTDNRRAASLIQVNTTALLVVSSKVRAKRRRAVFRSSAVSTEHVMLALEKQAEQMKAAVSDQGTCVYDEWTYFTDSPTDGITGNIVGTYSQHEYYCLAIRQTESEITMALNLNNGEGGESVSATVNVAVGDMFLNPLNADGTYTAIPDVNGQSKLYAVHFDYMNDNGDALGVYSNAVFRTVGASNAGFSSVAGYMNFIDTATSTNVNSAPFNVFGGGIDDEPNAGLGYLGDVTLNELIPGSSVFVDGIEVEYYWHEDFSYPEDVADWNTVTQFYGLDWLPNFGDGIYTRIIKIARTAFPANAQTYRAHVAAECFNDVVAGVFTICEIPSTSPSISRSSTNSPTVSKTPTATISVSTSLSSSAAPSMPSFGLCTCMDYDLGDVSDTDIGINTLSLGGFTANGLDTEGRLFVCGDANLRDFSVGDKLVSDTGRDDLVVMGDLSFSTGNVMSGNIRVNEAAGTSVTIGNQVLSGLTDGRAVLSYDTSSSIVSEQGFDCDGAQSFYENMALALNNIVSLGSVIYENDRVLLTRVTDSSTEYFDASCSQLMSGMRIELAGVPDGQTVVINWTPDSNGKCNFLSTDLVNSFAKVVFNFPDPTDITLRNTHLNANILAPFGTLFGNGGYVTGQIVVSTFLGGIQQNWQKCEACLQY